METVIASQEAPYELIERGRGSRRDRMEVGTAWQLVEGPGAGTTEVSVTFWADADEPRRHDQGQARRRRAGTGASGARLCIASVT